MNLFLFSWFFRSALTAESGFLADFVRVLLLFPVSGFDVSRYFFNSLVHTSSYSAICSAESRSAGCRSLILNVNSGSPNAFRKLSHVT